MDIALQRFAEYHALQGAFERRAVTERAKGILMERGSLDDSRPSISSANTLVEPTGRWSTSPDPSSRATASSRTAVSPSCSTTSSSYEQRTAAEA